MPRVANIHIPEKKRVVISLTYIYGIGMTSAILICKKLCIQHNRKTNSLSEEELVKLRQEVQNYQVEGDLRKEVSLNIKRKRDMRSYQGIRHINKLPVRGQNTKSNARTKRGKSASVAGANKKGISKK